MTNSAQIIRFNARGSERSGMADWSPMNPNELLAGDPKQRG